MSPMPRSRRRIPRPVRASAPVKRWRWRLALLAVLTNWNRYQVGRVILGLILTWLIGAVGLYLAEGRTNPGFTNFAESLWTVWILLFGGMDDSFAPKTGIGRFLAMFLLVAGV